MGKQDENPKELQLLPLSSASWLVPSPVVLRPSVPPPDVDLQLSITPGQTQPPMPPPGQTQRQVEAVMWHAREQIRMAEMEKAYAERVRELTRREMELAQAELARARYVWERARDDVARADLLRQNASSASPMEITCHSCRHTFRP